MKKNRVVIEISCNLHLVQMSEELVIFQRFKHSPSYILCESQVLITKCFGSNIYRFFLHITEFQIIWESNWNSRLKNSFLFFSYRVNIWTIKEMKMQVFLRLLASIFFFISTFYRPWKYLWSFIFACAKIVNCSTLEWQDR